MSFKLFYLFTILMMISCKQEHDSERFKKAVKTYKREMKEYTFSKCIEYSYPKRYGIDDSIAIGPMVVSDNLASKEFRYIIEPILDSLAKDQYLQSDKMRFDENVAENIEGKGPYDIGCLYLYNSKKLDSLVTIGAERIADAYMILD